MDKAKAAISDFVGRSGHHDTTVHEKVAPAVQHETIKPHQHEEINTAVDREVHQDHYHETVQPVKDREVLPEQHHAKLGGIQHQEFDHRDHDSTKRKLAEEQARFKDERQVDATTSSRSVAPAVGGEHQHHHIHETIQPVVQKETVQPHVVHTTVPIHEVHHNQATHHGTTALPAMTMDQFQSKGGSLTGREERHDEFQGIPKNIGGGTAGGFGAVRGMEHKDSPHSGLTGSTGRSDPTGPHDSRAGNKMDPRVDSDRMGTAGNTAGAGGVGAGQYAPNQQADHADRGIGGQGNLTGSSTQGGSVSSRHDNNNLTSNRENELASSTSGHHGTDGAFGAVGGTKAKTLSNDDDGSLPKALTEDRSKAVPHSKLADNQHEAGHNNEHSKPSMGDKLNPRKDADGDGKAGIMD